jgi:hypothetical protein
MRISAADAADRTAAAAAAEVTSHRQREYDDATRAERGPLRSRPRQP